MKSSQKSLLVALCVFAMPLAAHANHWTLETVWPSGLCAASQVGQPLCASANKAKAGHLLGSRLVVSQGQCPASTQSANAVALDTATAEYLAANDKGELQALWQRYGSCSGLTAEAYFSTTADMAKAIGQTAFGRFLQQNKGKPVAKQDLISQLASDYFVGADGKVHLICRGDYLVGVHFYPRSWSELFVAKGSGGMLEKAPQSVEKSGESVCKEQVRL